MRWFSARSIADQLSQNWAIGVSGNRRSFSAVFNQRKCFAAVERATYLASVIEVDSEFCFCARQEMVEFLSLNKLAKTDHLLSI
jgi:hypothetical protein